MDDSPRKEALEEAQKNKSKDFRKARAFRAMMETEGWKLYVELLNMHIGSRTQGLLEPTVAGGRDAEQHNKGAVYGLIMARDLPSVTVAAVKELANSANEEPET